MRPRAKPLLVAFSFDGLGADNLQQICPPIFSLAVFKQLKIMFPFVAKSGGLIQLAKLIRN